MQLDLFAEVERGKRLAKHNEGGVPHMAPFKPWKLEVYIAFETKKKATAF